MDCHSAKKRKGKLALQNWKAVQKGGKERGAAVIPKNSGQSPMYRMLINASGGEGEEEFMPPEDKGGPLKPEQIELIRRWIDEGASWPEGIELETKKT